MRRFRLLGMGLAMILTTATVAFAQDTSAAAKAFVEEHEKNIQPLEIEIGRAWWQANISISSG